MSNIRLVSYTRANPALNPETCAGISDLSTLWQKPKNDDTERTFADALCEYAARVCYRSTNKMGTAPNFIRNRVREGHEDVIEHVTVAVRGSNPYSAPFRIDQFNRFSEFTVDMDNSWTLSANLRVWREFFNAGKIMDALPWLKAVAPKVFDDFEYDGHIPTMNLGMMKATDDDRLFPREVGQARVTLMGYMFPIIDPYKVHGTATFLIEGVSRALTHQLVRHRLGSYSQESQRYVDLKKGGWGAIVPPSIMADSEALAALDFFWEEAEEVYMKLRELGIRKEDARFLLPNAAETRVVVSMGFKAWQHFLWLRAVDKAAQWEIRQVGQVILEQLYAIAPEVFGAHWQKYQDMID